MMERLTDPVREDEALRRRVPALVGVVQADSIGGGDGVVAPERSGEMKSALSLGASVSESCKCGHCEMSLTSLHTGRTNREAIVGCDAGAPSKSNPNSLHLQRSQL